MLRTQTWTPMICRDRVNGNREACVVHESFDDEVPQDARVHHFVTEEEANAITAAEAVARPGTIKPDFRETRPKEVVCKVHRDAGHVHGKALYDAVLDESRRQSTLAIIAKQVRPQFDHSDYEWHFDEQRRLVVKISGFTQAHLKSLKDSADIQFGPGLIVLE